MNREIQFYLFKVGNFIAASIMANDRSIRHGDCCCCCCCYVDDQHLIDLVKLIDQSTSVENGIHTPNPLFSAEVT